VLDRVEYVSSLFWSIPEVKGKEIKELKLLSI
jgi:hypothetical protein